MGHVRMNNSVTSGDVLCKRELESEEYVCELLGAGRAVWLVEARWALLNHARTRAGSVPQDTQGSPGTSVRAEGSVPAGRGGPQRNTQQRHTQDIHMTQNTQTHTHTYTHTHTH